MYCGDMKGEMRDLLRRDPAGGIAALFAGRRVHYSYNTRVAIRKACDILGLGPDDEILVPAYNCGSEVDPLRDAGLAIRLYPLDRCLRIDPSVLERMVGRRTRAIYLTHFFGFLQPDTAALRALCDRLGLWLIEDCALSLLSGPRPAEGHTGDVSVFCFHKFFPTLAGGALVINNPRLVADSPFDGNLPARQTLRYLARIGLSSFLGTGGSAAALRRLRRSIEQKPGEDCSGRPDVPAHYYFDPKLRDAPISLLASRPLGAFNAAEAIAARRRNYRLYLEALEGNTNIRPLFTKLPEDACPIVMPVLIEGNDRDALAASLAARGIAATPWWAGYNRYLDWIDCTDACSLKDHVLSLPLHQYLEPKAITHIAAELRALAGATTRMA